MAIKELIVGGGCFWCTEAVFERLKGVIDVESGYANGKLPNPDYRRGVLEILCQSDRIINSKGKTDEKDIRFRRGT